MILWILQETLNPSLLVSGEVDTLDGRMEFRQINSMASQLVEKSRWIHTVKMMLCLSLNASFLMTFTEFDKLSLFHSTQCVHHVTYSTQLP